MTLKRAGAIFVTALLTLVAKGSYDGLFSEMQAPALQVSQDWEVFGLVYMGADELSEEEGHLTPLGASPHYRHTALVENTGPVEARNVRIELTHISEAQRIFAKPALLEAEVGQLEPRFLRNDVERETHDPPFHARVVKVAVLPPKTSLKITVVERLAGPAVTLSRIARVLGDNASPSVPEVNADREQRRLAHLAELIRTSFPPPDLDRWGSAAVQATLEFTPTVND